MQAVEGLLVVVGQRLVHATVKPVLYYDHSEKDNDKILKTKHLFFT